MAKKLMIASLIVALAGITALHFLTVPSDQEVIEETLMEAVEASKDGRSGGVLEHLSRSFSFNGQPIAERGEIAKVIRISKPDVAVTPTVPIIEGDTATMKVDVRFNMAFQMYSLDERIENVEVVFERQAGTRWLFFPYPKWKIVEVNLPDQTGKIDLSF